MGLQPAPKVLDHFRLSGSCLDFIEEANKNEAQQSSGCGCITGEDEEEAEDSPGGIKQLSGNSEERDVCSR